jgi:hypothetical protein
MTVHRRSLVPAAAAALLLPACISVNASPVPITPAEAAARIAVEGAARTVEKPRISPGKTDFAIFPARPGETIPTRPIAKDATTAQKPEPDPTPPGPIVPPNPFKQATGGTVVPSDSNTFLIGHIRQIPIESPLLGAVRAFAEGKPEKAFTAIAGLDRPNQDLILAILPVLARAANPNLAADPAANAMMIEQLSTASERLEPIAALRIDNALFCRSAWGFRRYEPLPANRPYLPNHKAQLYLEVRNLVSELTTGPHGERFLTRARYAVEIRDAYGNLIDQPDPDDYRRPTKVARCDRLIYTRGPIQDFYIQYEFPVPATPGVYTATVTVTDANGRRTVKSAPVEFTVARP